MIKKGDTLIEVTLAVGIFSMVAVAVVAVMSNGTAGAQTSLETTLTREQIDAQAEALRFIHSAYISDMEGLDGRYSKLWERITDNAIELNSSNSDVTQFSIGSCDDMYQIQWPSTENKQPFAININYLGEYANLSKNELSDDVVSQAIKTFDSGFLVPAMTYPHLIYSNEHSNITADISNARLAENGVEGIYIVAVKDDNSTSVVDGSGKNASNVSAFYDFYIRTCWYGVGDNTPSTISTVIRLYDPNAIVIYTPEPEPEPGPKYNLVIMDDNRDYGYSGVSSVNVRVGSASGSLINCPLTDSSHGYYTCPNLTPGTNYYLYPALVSGYKFDDWININGNGQLGSTDIMNTYFTMGDADALLLLLSSS